MTIAISRRAMLIGGAAVLAGTAAIPTGTKIGAGSGSGRKQPEATPLRAGYDRAYDDVARMFWIATEGQPSHIHPTHKLDGPLAGLPVDKTMKGSDVWQSWAYLNQIYWNWKITGHEGPRAWVVAQARYLLSYDSNGRPNAYTVEELGSDGEADDTIHLHDDAALKSQALAQLFEASGDVRYLAALRSMIPRVVRRFADKVHAPAAMLIDGRETRVDGLPFMLSPHGIAYGTGGDLAKITTSWEVTIALSALEVYRCDGTSGYREYAQRVYARTLAEGRHESGNLWSSINLTTLSSDQSYFGYPKVGASSLSIQGTMAMCLLASRLATLPGVTPVEQKLYRADIAGFVRAMLRPQTAFGFVTSVMPVNGIFLPWEDSWTAFYHAPAFSHEVLAIPGADPGGLCAKVMAATARAALGTRTRNGRYTIDWAGELPTPADYGLLPGATGYETYYRAHPGSHFNAIAGSPQIMTNAQVLAAGLAGVVAEQRIRA